MQRDQRCLIKIEPAPLTGRSERLFPASLRRNSLVVPRPYGSRSSRFPHPRPSPRPKTARTLIYVVDDYPELALLAGFILESTGYRVAIFTDRDLALENLIFTKARPALLITDCLGCWMSGFELIEKCKAVQGNLKTLMVSALTKENLQSSPVQPDRFLGKPYSPPQLLEQVRLLIGKPAVADF